MNDKPVDHRVKHATTVKSGRAVFFVWECVCGVSSLLHQTKEQANEAYRLHKTSAAIEHVPGAAPFTLPTREEVAQR